MTPAKQIWILDEGSQGHVVQSRGMVRELAKAVALEVSEIRIHCALPGRLGRSVVKRLLHLCPRAWLFRALHQALALPAAPPDLLVASGPLSLTALIFLARHYGCPSVFVQGTVVVPEGAVTAVMRPFEGLRRDDYIFLPLLFTEITPQVVDAAKEQFLLQSPLRPQGPVNALFIGNSSGKIRFARDDWQRIVRFVNDRWRADGSQWLVTTSYRTAAELEQLFKRGIEPGAILDAVWYGEAPRKVTREFLGLADRVFVTMDSLTMLTEAVASGRPTYALCPAALPAEPSNSHLRYVHDLAANGFITRVQPDRTAALPPAPARTPPIDYAGAIADLLTRLHWPA